MKFAIKHSNGTTFYEGKPKYNGIFGKPSYIEFSEIASDKPIAFAIGDYVDYSRTGFRYRLYSIPQVDKSATKQTHGSAFVYKNVQFYAATKDLELALFRDLVMYDNTVHFSSIPNVDTYEDVYGIARRIQANLDSQYPNEWTINVISSTSLPILSEVRQFSVSDGTCLDALNEIYNLWKGIGWIYSVVNGKNTITIGKPNIQTGDITTDIFAYGHDNGLKVIGKAVSGKADYATRVYAYGSDRNMPTRYYNNLSANIKDKASIYVPHLMLPLTDWRKTGVQYDASKAYLDSGASKVIPKILRFDGSGDLPDIYPSIEGVSRSGHRIDEIVSASSPSDDGMYTDDSEKIISRTVVDIDSQSYTEYIYPTQKSITCGYEPIISITRGSKAGKGKVELTDCVAYIDGLAEYIKGTPKAKLIVEVNGNEVRNIDVQSKWVSNGRLQYGIDKFEFNSNTSNANVNVYIRLEAEIVYTKIASSESDAGIQYTYGVTSGSADFVFEYSLSSTFDIVMRDPGFDISEMGTTLSSGLATMSMKDGMCAGRDFQINKCVYNSTTGLYTLTLQRQEDTSLSQWFPNSSYPIASGDHFVLLDMQMPSSYVEIAEERLHDAALEALGRLSKPKMTYTPTVDSKAVYVSEITLLEGMYMPVQDADLIDTEISTTPHTTWVLIDSMTIAENEDAIPIWSVTLRDEKAESMLQQITGEVTRGNKFIKDLQDEGKRRPVGDGLEGDDPNAHPKVYIEAQTFFFVYDDKKQLLSADNILLTAVTEGINNPYFQWYYLGTEDWVALTGETEQTLKVLADSEIYYQNNELVEDFKVIVSDGSNTYESSVRIAKVQSGNGYMVSLNNPAHIFPATEDHAEESSDTVTVLAYKGQTAVDVTIGTITGDGDGIPDGMTVTTGGVAMARTITIAVDEDLTQGSGLLYIPVTVVEVQPEEDTEGEETDPEPPSAFSVTLVYSWALAFKGGQGDPGSQGDPGDDGYSSATVYLYKRSLLVPTASPANLVYTFADGSLSGNLNGWSTSIDSDTSNGPIYVIKAYVTGNGDTATINTGWLPNGDWTSPARLTGDNGAIGKVQRGINEWVSGGIEDGRGSGEDGYQGLGESTRTDLPFYDVVYVTNSQGGKDFYYCWSDANGGASANKPGTTAGSAYWRMADQFDFIATKVFLAESGFIDVLSSNGIYMKDTASDGIVAGMVGGLTSLGEPVVNFFAGATNNDVNSALFKVLSDGSMYATKGFIGPYEIGNNGLSFDNYDDASCEYGRYGLNYKYGMGAGSEYFTVQMSNGDEPITSIGSQQDGRTALKVYSPRGTAIEAEGAVLVNDENVVTSPDGALHIEIVTDDYPATLADDTIYIKVAANAGN